MLRQGDLALFLDSNGGNIQNINGEPVMDGGIETVAILSLFGTQEKEVWFNEYLNGSEKYTAEFYSFMVANSITLKNLLTAQEYALRDLQWLKDDGIADEIVVELTTFGKNRVNMTIGIYADGNTVFENTYEVNWGYQIDDPAHNRIETEPDKVYDKFTRKTSVSDIRITDSGDTRIVDSYY